MRACINFYDKISAINGLKQGWFQPMLGKILFFIILYSLPILNAFAGAWVQEKGHGLDILAVRRYESNQFWDSNGNQQSSPVYKKWEIANYIEYGLYDKLTVGFYASALQSHTNAAGTRTGDYDNMLFGRYLVWSGDSKVLSLQAFIDKLGTGVEFNIPAPNVPTKKLNQAR